MSLQKFDRKTMQGLRDETDRQSKRLRLSVIISEIYRGAIEQARNSKETVFKYEIVKSIYGPQVRDWNYDFMMDNIDLIIYNLNVSFPECSVQLKKFTTMSDGTLIDLSTISDTTTSALKCKYFIVIDWS
jgi:hypothetical protein